MKLKALPLIGLIFLAGCLPDAGFDVSLKVIDEETGKPIPDAWVFVTAYVEAEPPFDPPYDKPLAGTRLKTDAQGMARLKDVAGLSYRGEPQDKLWKMLESRQPQLKRRISGVEGGSIFVLARGYGALSVPFGVKENAGYLAKLKKDGRYEGLVRLGLKGEESPIELSLKDIRKGTTLTLNMKRPESPQYLQASFCPQVLRYLLWVPTSEKTGTTKEEKSAVLDFILNGVTDLGDKAYESCGHGKPSDWFHAGFEREFLDHEDRPGNAHDDSLALWMTEKALEILPPGYEEIKKHAEMIKGGVVAEDAEGRSINHYYNPYDGASKMSRGEQALKWAEIGYPKNPENDGGWEDALRYYREGDKGMAYRALGQVLGVLEDLSIPMRTHGITYSGADDYKESRFEVYFSTLASQNNGSLPPRFSWEAREPSRLPDVKSVFDAQARLSFGKFKLENREVNFDDYYGLASVTKRPADADLELMGGYLFPKAIANAAGVMKMFYDGLHVQGYAQKPVEDKKTATDVSVQGGGSPNSSPQGDQPKRRHTQKEVRAQMKEDERKNAAEIQGKLDNYINTASDRRENPERRRSALELLGHSRDLRAAKTLLDMTDDTDQVSAHGALIGLQIMSKTLDGDSARLAEFKKIIEAKARAIGKEEPRDLNRATVAVGLLNNIGYDAEAVQLAQKVLAKGRYKILYEFCYWDESVEPPVFRIRSAAKQLFVDSTAKDRAEEARVAAAAFLSKSGDKSDAFPALVDVMLHGNDRIQRHVAMDELRAIGDEPSRQAVRDAAKDPDLQKSANHLLMFWDKRPK